MTEIVDFLENLYHIAGIFAIITLVILLVIVCVICGVFSLMFKIASFVILFLLCGGGGFTEEFIRRKRASRRRRKNGIRTSRNDGYDLLELGESSNAADEGIPMDDERSGFSPITSIPKHRSSSNTSASAAASSPRLQLQSHHSLGNLTVRGKKNPSSAATDSSPSDSAAAIAARFYLRTSPFSLIDTFSSMGQRSDKSFFLVKHDDGTECLMTIVPISTRITFPFGDAKAKKFFNSLLSATSHPYVWPTTSVDYIVEKNMGVVFRPFNKLGSLRDVIHACNPRYPWSRKYTPSNSSPLKIAKVQKYGKQILTALSFFKSAGLSYGGSLHSGNVLISSTDNVALSDYEIPFFGLGLSSPRVIDLNVDSDVIGFGYLLFEMLTGTELADGKWDSNLLKTSGNIPTSARDCLDLIFNGDEDGSAVSIDSILGMEFFRDYPIENVTEEYEKLLVSKMKKYRDVLNKIQERSRAISDDLLLPTTTTTTTTTHVSAAPAVSSPLASASASAAPPPPPPPSAAPSAPTSPTSTSTSIATSALKEKVLESGVSTSARSNLLDAIHKGKTLKKVHRDSF